MNKIFFDIGANEGQSIKQFYEQIEDAALWRIYAFEPIQDVYNILCSNTSKYNIYRINAGIGTKTSQEKIYVADRNKEGSSIMLNKQTNISYTKYEIVRLIGLIDLINNNSSDRDIIFIKMNIEGAEYDLMKVLPLVMNKISYLYIKTHANKFSEPTRTNMNTLEQEFLNCSKQYKTKLYLDNTENLYNFKGFLS